jgi:hypothetical protein
MASKLPIVDFVYTGSAITLLIHTGIEDISGYTAEIRLSNTDGTVTDEAATLSATPTDGFGTISHGPIATTLFTASGFATAQAKMTPSGGDPVFGQEYVIRVWPTKAVT